MTALAFYETSGGLVIMMALAFYETALEKAPICEVIGELSLLVTGDALRGPLTNGQVNRPMALYWPVAWGYWWNKPLAGGLEQIAYKWLLP